MSLGTLSVKEAQKRLGLSERALLAEVKNGSLRVHPIYVGRPHPRFAESEIVRYSRFGREDAGEVS